MQVAHEQAPPQSASMPTMPLRTAPSMIDCPLAMSMARSVPSGSSKTIFAIGFSCLAPHVFHGHGFVAKSCRLDLSALGDELLGHHEFRRAIDRVDGDQRSIAQVEHGEGAACVGIATHH